MDAVEADGIPPMSR